MALTDAPNPTTVPQAPYEVAKDTFLLPAVYQAAGAPLAVPMSALLIRGEQPILVDTGAPIHRQQHLDALFSLVDPEDVRWVFISHEDADHFGNAHAVMEACPNATLVASWFLCERVAADRLDVPPMRWRWVGDGEALDVGDRTLVAVRPPVYDSPTSRGLFDPTTGVYWAGDAYATAVPHPVTTVAELDPELWEHGFATFQGWNSPWLQLVDERRFAQVCDHVERLGVTTITGCHSPAIERSHVAQAFSMMKAMPTTPIPPQPDQLLLDEIVASLGA